MIEHRDILDAIESGDADRAASAARIHSRRARDHMLDNLKDNAGATA
jgi:DNA-binding GntR family transcriptional regulator